MFPGRVGTILCFVMVTVAFMAFNIVEMSPAHVAQHVTGPV